MSAPSSCSSSVTLEQVYATVTTRCIPGWHRRPLPDVAIPLNSDRGKRLFREALLNDGLHGYFSLAETFHTQAEPSYCGPGTLSMGKTRSLFHSFHQSFSRFSSEQFEYRSWVDLERQLAIFR